MARNSGGILKNRRWILFICGIIATSLVLWEDGSGVHAQSQTDVKESPGILEEGSASNQPTDSPVLATQKDQVNYTIGVNLIGNFRKQGVDIDLNMVIKGMQDAFSGANLLLSDDELQKAMMLYQAEVRRKQGKSRSMTAATNRQEGEAFLAENREKEGVVTLPSGLQYRILKAGDGKQPTDTDTVTCHYQGTFINGTEFDSSHRKGRPATLKVNDVIPGWREALMRMPVGSTWQIFVPSRLAYGERGSSGHIGPNTTLVFEIELLSIQ